MIHCNTLCKGAFVMALPPMQASLCLQAIQNIAHVVTKLGTTETPSEKHIERNQKHTYLQTEFWLQSLRLGTGHDHKALSAFPCHPCEVHSVDDQAHEQSGRMCPQLGAATQHLWQAGCMTIAAVHGSPSQRLFFGMHPTCPAGMPRS